MIEKELLPPLLPKHPVLEAKLVAADLLLYHPFQGYLPELFPKIFLPVVPEDDAMPLKEMLQSLENALHAFSPFTDFRALPNLG